MLRRGFIKSTSLTMGGIIILSSIPLLHGNGKSATTPSSMNGLKRFRHRVYHLHGDARSGCATPPELASLLENGISAMPPV